jgi:hypothetical protein
MWNFKHDFTEEEKKQNAQKMKGELEKLKNIITGIISLEVIITTLPSGDMDVVLNSVFETEEALASYQIHPEHVRVSKYVGTITCNRTCIDYIEG